MNGLDPGQDRGVRTLESWLESPARQFATALVAGVVIATLSASQLYVNWSVQGYEARFGDMLVAELVEWSLWAVAAPIIIWLDRRWGFVRFGPLRASATHVVSALVWFGLLNAALTAITFRMEDVAGGVLVVYLSRAVLKLPASLLVYGLMVGLTWGIRAVIRQHRLRQELLEAQLQNLRSQIHPHFLFNTLHTVGALVRREDRDGAIETLVALGDLLRRSLSHSRVDRIPLGEELEFARAYLGIQERRHGDRLQTRIDVPVEVMDHSVPAFLLQPIIENSIRHGLDLEDRPGTVEVSAELDGDTLVITVADSGEGSERSTEGLGLGLTNLRRRLDRLYGSRGAVALHRRPDGGTEVTVRLPRVVDLGGHG